METIGERITWARKKRGLSQADLSKAIGITRQAMWQIEEGVTRSPKPETLFLIADALKVKPRWLVYKEGAPLDDQEEDKPAVRFINLISWVNAGKGDEITDPYGKGDGEEMIAVDGDLAMKLSKNSFALRIRGTSMVRPDGEGFHPGDIIIIDPMVKPKPGDYVVAYLELEDKSTFKKYRSRGMNKDGISIFELVPLNPDYPTITVDENCPGRVIGTVMEYRKRRKEATE